MTEEHERADGVETETDALAAGIYCTIPGTELLPLATLVGACVRFRESGREPADLEAGGGAGDDA